MAKKLNLLSGLSNARTRSIVILFGAVIAAGVAIAFLRGNSEGADILSQQGSKTVAVPSEIKSTPGGAVSEQYRELLVAENERRAQEALKKKTSAIPTIIGAVSDNPATKNTTALPTEVVANNPQGSNQAKIQFGEALDTGFLNSSFARSPQDRERELAEAKQREADARQRDMKNQQDKARFDAEQAKMRQAELDRQRRLAEQAQKDYLAAVAKTEQQMRSYASEAYAAWTKFPLQQYVQGELASCRDKGCPGADRRDNRNTTRDQNRGRGGPLTPDSLDSVSRSARNQNEKVYIKAGTVLYGVLDTAVNSDEPGPILATVTGGKYKGTKLLGEFLHEAQQEKVTIKFTQMAVPQIPQSLGVSAVAIDPDTARTALATHTNKHYLLRYGSLFASAFISGYGKAILQSGATTTTSPLTGATTTTNPPLDNSQIIKAALGEVGTQWGQATKKYFDTPYTVTIDQGTAVGVLFLSDVNVTEVIAR